VLNQSTSLTGGSAAPEGNSPKDLDSEKIIRNYKYKKDIFKPKKLKLK